MAIHKVISSQKNSLISKHPQAQELTVGISNHASSRVLALKRCPGLSRSSSNSRNNDRLQERLAKAMVKDGSTRGSDSPASTSGFSSRDAESPRTSTDIKIDDTGSGPICQVPGPSAAAAVPGREMSSRTDEKWHQGLNSGITTTLPVSTSELTVSSEPSTESRFGAASLQLSATGPLGPVPSDIDTSFTAIVEQSSDLHKSAQEYEAVLTQMQSDYEISETRRQEETHFFMERIDALQSKLQYLTQEALGTARTVITTAPAGGLDRRLAEKDEQIALLMEEGEKLSKAELKHITSIKSLRSGTLEAQKQSTKIGERLERAEREIQNAKERAKRAEDAEQRELGRSRSLLKIKKENESLKTELNSYRAIAADLKFQLAHAPPEARAAENAAQTEALEEQRSVCAQLRDDLSKAKIERELSEEKHRYEIRRIMKEAERENERARATEMELRTEQSVRHTFDL